jgi:hypothetical protein
MHGVAQRCSDLGVDGDTRVGLLVHDQLTELSGRAGAHVCVLACVMDDRRR